MDRTVNVRTTTLHGVPPGKLHRPGPGDGRFPGTPSLPSPDLRVPNDSPDDSTSRLDPDPRRLRPLTVEEPLVETPGEPQVTQDLDPPNLIPVTTVSTVKNEHRIRSVSVEVRYQNMRHFTPSVIDRVVQEYSDYTLVRTLQE